MRKSLFKWHSYSALFAMLPLLIISVTGSILVFKVEIDNLLRPEHMLVNVSEVRSRVSLDTLMQTVLEKNPAFELGGWELFDDKQRTDAGYLIKRGTEDWYKVYIDQYSGKVLSQPQIMTHYLTDWLLELHYNFLLHFNGTIFGFVIGLIMLFLGISGVILYRNFWKKIFTLRLNAAKRMIFSDVHKFIGIVSSPILIIIAFTGAYWNISLIIHEVEEHSSGDHVYITKPLHSDNISFEALRLQSSQEISSFSAGYLAMPHEPELEITFFGEVDSSNPLNSQYGSTVTFNKTTGELLSKMDIRNTDFLAVFLDSFRKLHFGYFGGLTTRIIWCVIGLSPVILAFTGFYMFYLRRKVKSKKAKAC